ncbi:hypothetical protein KP509_08G017500 [Ceratopteris richardii]|nr:hypothetical protein KP509_08G017500 [Ceratopteris richardii]
MDRSGQLFSLYLQHGSIEDAAYLCSIVKPDVSIWNSIMSRLCRCGSAERAFQLFGNMIYNEIRPDCVTFVILLKACGSVEEGRLIHGQVVEYVSVLNIYVESTLVDVYGRWGSISDACHVFDDMQERNLVTWSVMIAGFVESGCTVEAFNTFHKLICAKLRPNEVTFINILRACTCVLDMENTQKIHSSILEDGFEVHPFVANALIDAYARCGSLWDARHVFTGMRSCSVVSWTSLIQGYAQHGHIEDVFGLFWDMENKGVKPNSVTISAVLKLCASKKLVSCGEQVHNYILLENMETAVFVENCLLDMYIKCGQVKAAQRVFSRMSTRDVVSCSTMINAYAQCERPHKAFSVFARMIRDGIKPNEVTYLGLLQACSFAGQMERGNLVYHYLIKDRLERHLVIGNALIDMYSKSGTMKAAHVVFNKMYKRDLVSWNSLLGGYCQHGYSSEAFDLFEKMRQGPFKPDNVTFLGLLSVCSYAGLVADGRWYFNIMTEECSIKPTAEHCACMIDLLGRVGCVHEALAIINKSTIDSVMVWNALLGACKISGDVDVAEIATKNIMKLDPNNTAACVQLSNMYATVSERGGREKRKEIEGTFINV